MSEPEHILVRAPNWIGDAVMSLPFFASLRAIVPHATVTCLCYDSLSPLYTSCDAIDAVVPLDTEGSDRGVGFVLRNAWHLRRASYDLAFTLAPSLSSALMLWLGGVPERVGLNADFRAVFLTQVVACPPRGQRPHRVKSYLSMLHSVWLWEQRVDPLQFAPSAEDHSSADELWNQNQLGSRGPVLALGAASAQPARMWMPERFGQLAARWVTQTGGSVILLGARGDRAHCDEVCTQAATSGIHNLAGCGHIGVAAALLKRADLFVGNDSGLAHLAAAVGTKTLVISGPGDPREVGPYAPHARSIAKPVFCAPCHKGTCWRKDHPLECLDLISVDDVWAHIAAELK